jgi:hypothetical protein
MGAQPMRCDCLEAELGMGNHPVVALNPDLTFIPAPPYDAFSAGALNGCASVLKTSTLELLIPKCQHEDDLTYSHPG